MASGSVVSFAMKDDNVESKVTGKPFEELYTLEREIGRGAFSIVALGHHIATGKEYAIKIMQKAEMEEFDKKCLVEEIDVLTELNHPHIIRLHDVLESQIEVFMVLEMVHGGELLDRLIQKKAYTEREARDVCKIVMQAMQHVHDHKIAHRDLKPENLLLASPDDDTTLKIADFGFAKHCPNDECLKTQCGSALHVAPEILLNVPYGTKVDMWALGVIHYTIIGGRQPFWAEDIQVTFQKILKADYQFRPHLWGHVSEDCKDMIRGMLTLDPKARWDTQAVLNCKWMHDEAAELAKNALKMGASAKAKPKQKKSRPQFDGNFPDESEVVGQQDQEQEQEILEEEDEVAEESEEEDEDLSCVVTRDVYTAFTIDGQEEEPLRREYFALAQATGNYFATVLKKKYGDDFDVVEMTLRKSLFDAAKPNASYNLYVEWDITAHFNCDKDKMPPKRDICTHLVRTDLLPYILEHLHPMQDTAFARVTNVYAGYYAF